MLKDVVNLPRTEDNDNYVLLAVDYLNGKQTPEQIMAERVYSKEVLASVKWEVEARLIAGQTDQEIAHRLSTSTDVVRFYEAWFYNIRDRLDNHSYIFQRLIYPIVEVVDGKPSREAVWKFFAFCGGSGIIDEVIYDSNILRGAQIKNFWKQNLAHTVLRRLAVKAKFNEDFLDRNVDRLLSSVSEDGKKREGDELHKILVSTMTSLGWNWGNKKLIEHMPDGPNFDNMNPESNEDVG